MLANELPSYQLPNAVHAHTRHYMPQGKLVKGREDTKLVFDAFLRISPDDELIAVWPHTSLSTDCFALAAHLAERMNYFGRAESLVCARAEYDHGRGICINCRPENSTDGGSVPVETLAPLSPESYAAQRARLMPGIDQRSKSKKALVETTLPPSLFEAIQVETATLQAAGWSQPPTGRIVIYHRPEIAPRPATHRARPSPPAAQPRVARLVLAGWPQPRIEDAVRIGEVFRLALMSKIAHNGHQIPPVLSGRTPDGAALRDPQHHHAFFLPEDADRDGFIDHLVLYVRDGLSVAVTTALDSLYRLWVADRRGVGPDDDPDGGRKEWRIALEGSGDPAEFADCALLRRSRTWESITPYLRPWHTKTAHISAETAAMVQKECRIRGLPECEAEFAEDGGRAILIGSGAPRSVLHFHRFRSRRGLIQPDRSGTALRLRFEQPVGGPIALGFGCHFGLGLFRSL